jgi:ParB family chromosome partitioning protein
LGALIPTPPSPPPAADTSVAATDPRLAATARGEVTGLPKQLPIEQVEPNREQPRKRFDDERLRELADSIRTQGIIQPIIVTPLPGVGGSQTRYQIIAGERRWRAAQLAGLQTVPVVIRDTPEANRLELALVENLQRADLDPIEEARAYEALIELHDYSQADLATRVGKDRSTVANTMRLLKLPAKVQDLVIAGSLSMGHARALLGFESPAQMQELALEIIRKGLSVRQTEAEVRKRSRAPKPEREVDDDRKRHEIIVRDLENRLRRHLGVQAKLRTGKSPKGPGTIELPYANLDELQRLLHQLLGDPPS